MKEPIYVAFNKPYGVLTAFTDEEDREAERETLKNYIDLPDIYPVGRLDLDSEGMLLLTDDGPLAHRLTDPRYNHPKTYLVQVEGVPDQAALAKLESGVEVKGELTRRAQVIVVPEPNLPERRKPVTPHGPTTWLRIVLREGKKRQIRHMTAAVGLPTLRIVRIAVGPVALNDLQPGEWRFLTVPEVSALRELVKTSPNKGAIRPGKTVGSTRGTRKSALPQTENKPDSEKRPAPGKRPGTGKPPARRKGSTRGTK